MSIRSSIDRHSSTVVHSDRTFITFLMNFESFRSKVRASALKAAEAALSVTTLDQMAADDDYIHSEGLNIPSKSSKKRHGASEKLNELIPTETIQQSQSLPGRVVVQAQPLLPIVVDLLKDKQIRNTNRKKFVEDASDDEDDGNDPIMSMIRKKPSTHESRQNMQKPLQELTPVVIAPMETEDAKRKNPNRFMSDLDERLSKVEEARPTPRVQQHQPPSGPSTEQTRWILFQSVASSPIGQYLSQQLGQRDRNEEEQKPLNGPLVSRRNDGVTKDYNDDDDDDDESEIQLIVSSSVLGAEETAELERISLATQQSTDPLTMVSYMLKQNPHNVFIIVTLVLGSAAYFYSRSRGSEDDVN